MSDEEELKALHELQETLASRKEARLIKEMKLKVYELLVKSFEEEIKKLGYGR